MLLGGHRMQPALCCSYSGGGGCAVALSSVVTTLPSAASHIDGGDGMAALRQYAQAAWILMQLFCILLPISQ
jgi:hypothetical protein